MNYSHLRNLVTPIIFIALSACGGGGGGGGDSQPPPEPDTTFGTLAINEDTADALLINVAYTDGFMQFAQSIANSALRYGGIAGETYMDCSWEDGHYQAELDDKDNNFTVSSGDTLDLNFVDCRFDDVNDIVSGSVTLEIEDIKVSSSIARLTASVRTVGPVSISDGITSGAPVNLSADFKLTFTSAGDEYLKITPLNENSKIIVESIDSTESIERYSFEKTLTLDPTKTYPHNTTTNLKISSHVHSTYLNGTFTCEDDNLAFRQRHNSPISTSLICRGLNNSAIRMVNQTIAEIDSEGKGDFTPFASLSWGELIENFFAVDSGLKVSDISGPLEARRMPFRTVNITADKANNRLLILTEYEDPTWPNALLSYHPESGSLNKLYSFQTAVKKVRVSKNGERIYVSSSGDATIYRLNASGTIILDSITPGSDNPYDTALDIIDFDISPTNPDVIAALFARHSYGPDIEIIDGTYRRPETATSRGVSPVDFKAISFTSDGSHLYAADYTALLVNVTEEGIGENITFGPFATSFMKRSGQLIYSGGMVTDENNGVLAGSYREAYPVFEIDNLHQRMFFSNSNELLVYDLHKYVPIAAYDLNLLDSAAPQQLTALGNHLFLRGVNEIHIIDLNDIEVQNTDECSILAGNGESAATPDQLSCPIRDAVYDPSRHKILALLDSTLGEKGNTLAVINPDNLAVESYNFVGSEPSKIELSPDFSTASIMLSGEDNIATIDLATMQRVRSVPIVVTEEYETNRRVSPDILDLAQFPLENDTYIVTSGDRTSTPNFTYRLVRDGEILSSVKTSFSGNSSQPNPLCNSEGVCYARGESGVSSTFQRLEVLGDSLILGHSFSIADDGFYLGHLQAKGSNIYNLLGYVLNTNTEAASAHFDLSGGESSNSTDSYNAALTLDSTEDKAYYFLSNYFANDLVFFAFKRSTGEQTALTQIPIISRIHYPPKLIEIGDDKLCAIGGSTAGLLVLDKPGTE